MTVATAPTVEIGYAQQAVSNWWLYDPNETTPELQWPMSVYVYDQMRRQDAQVTSVLRAVTLPVRRTPWRIDPNGARAEVVQFVADDLGLPIVGSNPGPPPRSKDRFSWPEHLRQALLMLPFGHMFFEVVFRVSADGSRAHLRKLAPRMPRTIERIDVADDGGLISISQYWMKTTERPKPIPVDRLVAYVHELEGGNWLGTSILRPAYKNWLLKDRLLRVQAQTIERNGMGIPLYKAQENATETDMASGLAMATAWRAGDAAGSATPFGADLVLRGVEGTLPDAEPAIRYHDEQIARAVLAHFLNLGTQTGSWALGTTFADFFTLSLQTLAQQIADTATCHIVEDMVDINFGPDEPAPRVTFDEIGSRQAATAAAIKTLVDAGVIRPDEVLEESSRQQYGLPPADPSTVRTPPAAGGAPDPNAGAAQDLFGPNSVAAAAAGEPDPKDEAAEAADDEPADDETAALVVAFAELTGQVLAADWNPQEHLRDRHGKFRTMVDRIAGALTKWHAEGGHGDPLGAQFNREQLRRAAVSVGLNPKRGASEAELKKLFYDHARTKLDGKPDLAPGDKTASPKSPLAVAPSPLDAGIKSGVKSREHITTAGLGRVDLVTFKDGSRAIHKKHTTADAKRQTDAAQLAATTAEALGVKTPAVRRINNREIYMEYVASPTAYFDPKMDVQTIKELAASQEGRRLGLFDLLISYDDRSNRENWAFDGGHVTALDHDTAWEETGRPDKPLQHKWRQSPFDAQFIDGKKWKAGAVTADEAAQVRAELERLAPQFEKLGRSDWHDFMLKRLAAIAGTTTSAPGDGARTASVRSDALAEFRAMSAADARDALDLKKVDELKPMLREAGLPVSGRKRDLVDRLVEHVHGGGSTVPKVKKAGPGSTIGDVEPGSTVLQQALGEAPLIERPAGNFAERPYSGPDGAVLARGVPLTAGFKSDLVDIRQGKFEMRPGLTADESRALDRYALSRVSDPLNTALRRGEVSGFGQAQIADQVVDLDEEMTHLDSAISAGSLAKDTILYRGALMRPADIGKLQVGAVTSESGFLSTTTGMTNAFEIIHWRKGSPKPAGRSPVVFEILAPEGTPAGAAHIDENEVLLGRGQRMQVVDILRPTHRGDSRVITLKLLGDSAKTSPAKKAAKRQGSRR